jgi:hypothetical protein
MWRYLLHLWAFPPVDARLVCPAPRQGEAADPFGLYNQAEVLGIWRNIAAASVVGVLVLLLLLYLLPRASLSARFVRGWYLTLGAATVYCFLVPLAVGKLTTLSARPDSCTTRPAAFPVHLTVDLLVPRMWAGAVWGFLAFILLSLIFTRVLARGPVAGGFFHYRGCPWPRWNPLEG